MTRSFSLGVDQLWDELQQMQASGLYWLHIDYFQDVGPWCKQLLSAQATTSKTALISITHPPSEILLERGSTGPAKVPLFSLPEKQKALQQLPNDLVRALNLQDRLLLLVAPSTAWHKVLPGLALGKWLENIAVFLRQQKSTLLVISHGGGAEDLRSRLLGEHRHLLGLARLYWRQDIYHYQVAFWFNHAGITSNQEVDLVTAAQGWKVKAAEQAPPQYKNDEHLILCQQSVLQGGLAPSSYWQLFANNTALVTAALEAQAATIVLSLHGNQDIEALAQQLHTLRRSCGNGLKLIVREVSVGLRYTDERLLLACGANLIVAHQVPLSRFLVQIEAVQGQRYVRHVPADISLLLDTLMPLKLKGVLHTARFCCAIEELMAHSLIAENAKGILIALQPVAGLRAEQALTLCKLNRMGDIATAAGGTLYLFLYSCAINDIERALRHIFQLPVAEVIQDFKPWYQDAHILEQLPTVMNHHSLAWQLKSPITATEINTVEELAPAQRRQPYAVTLPILVED